MWRHVTFAVYTALLLQDTHTHTHTKESHLVIYMDAELFHSWKWNCLRAERRSFFIYMYIQSCLLLFAFVCYSYVMPRVSLTSSWECCCASWLHSCCSYRWFGSHASHRSNKSSPWTVLRPSPGLSFILHGPPSANCFAVPVIAGFIAGSHTLHVLVNNGAVIFTALWNLCF
jgi:hypothetical protein